MSETQLHKIGDCKVAANRSHYCVSHGMGSLFAPVENADGKQRRKESIQHQKECAEMAEIKYEIIKHIGVLSESAKGWTKELNLISWNGRESKYDIREWAPGREKMGKGVTLSEDELATLKGLL